MPASVGLCAFYSNVIYKCKSGMTIPVCLGQFLGCSQLSTFMYSYVRGGGRGQCTILKKFDLFVKHSIKLMLL